MKNKFYTIGTIIILVLVAIAFVLPMSAIGNNQKQEGISFGSYNGKQIKYEQGTDFTKLVSQYADMYNQMGYQIDSSSYYYIFSNAFNQTVQQMAFSEAVQKSGWAVPEQAVNRNMVSYFTDETGNYSPKLYHQADPKDVAELRQQIEKNLLAGRYYDDMFGAADKLGTATLFGVKSPAKEAAFIDSIGKAERGFNMAYFNMSNYPDSEKIAYGNANKEKFVRYDMSVITMDTKKDADAILGRINNNSITFEDAASSESRKSYSDTEGKLNQSYHYQLSQIVSNEDDLQKIVALSSGAVSPVVQTGTTYSIFRMEGTSTQADFSDESTVRDVFNYLNSYESGVIEDYYISEAEKLIKLSNATTFANACGEFGVTEEKITPFPINYGNSSVMDAVSTLDIAAQNSEQFLETAFSLKAGQISDPIVVGNNIVVIQLAEITERPSETDADNIVSQLNSYDSSAAQTALMASPKIKNDVMTAFFSNFLN